MQRIINIPKKNKKINFKKCDRVHLSEEFIYQTTSDDIITLTTCYHKAKKKQPVKKLNSFQEPVSITLKEVPSLLQLPHFTLLKTLAPDLLCLWLEQYLRPKQVLKTQILINKVVKDHF